MIFVTVYSRIKVVGSEQFQVKNVSVPYLETALTVWFHIKCSLLVIFEFIAVTEGRFEFIKLWTIFEREIVIIIKIQTDRREYWVRKEKFHSFLSIIYDSITIKKPKYNTYFFK